MKRFRIIEVKYGETIRRYSLEKRFWGFFWFEVQDFRDYDSAIEYYNKYYKKQKKTTIQSSIFIYLD